MLKVTRIARDEAIWLKLEGKLVGPWVDECRTACDRESADGRRLVLDLSALTFADARGVNLIRGLIEGGAGIPLCSSFVAELLRSERS